MKHYPHGRTNVAVVTASEEHGWELIWRNFTPAEEEDPQIEYTLNSCSDNMNPVYGVIAEVLTECGTALCPLWESWQYTDDTYENTDFYIVRSETLAEWEHWEVAQHVGYLLTGRASTPWRPYAER